MGISDFDDHQAGLNRMKKQPSKERKKLALRRESIRLLQSTELSHVFGGQDIFESFNSNCSKTHE